MNGVYFEEEDTEVRDMDGVKGGVDERHGEIAKEVQGRMEENKEREESEEDGGNEAKIKALLEGLLATNVQWNGLIAESRVMHGESQAARNGLVEQLMSKYAQMTQWTEKVQQMPATKLL